MHILREAYQVFRQRIAPCLTLWHRDQAAIAAKQWRWALNKGLVRHGGTLLGWRQTAQIAALSGV